MLQHKMNPSRTAFTTEPIGSFVKFYKDTAADGAVELYGEARVSKRDKRITDMLLRMYESGRLHVSFEIMAVNCRQDGNVVVIDADESNNLMAMAIVSCPAYEDSNAVLMVAGKDNVDGQPANNQIQGASATVNEEGENMDNEKMIPAEQTEENLEQPKPEEAEVVESAEVEQPQEEKQEEPVVEPEEEQHEEKPAEEEPETVEVEPTEEQPVVEEQHEEPATEEATEEAEHIEMLPIEPVHPEEIIEDVAELHREIEELKMQIEELLPYKLAAEKQEREAKMASMRAFAEKHGLDQENEKVAAAIGAMDYQALMELSMEVAEEKPAPQVQMASFEKMSAEDPRAFLYARGTYRAQ